MKKRVIALLLVFALALSLAACGSSDTSEAASDASEDTAAATTEEAAPAEDTTEEAAPAEEATASSGSVTHLNVGTANVLGTLLIADNNGDCWGAVDLVFDSLFSFDPQTREASSDVLSDWSYSDDGSTLSLTIKPGVMFSNGVEATAEDVLYSISYYVYNDTQLASFYIPYDFDNAVISDDGYTVDIPLTTDFSPTLDEVGNLPLYNKAWSETAEGEDWTLYPVGSGPFEVTDYVTDSHIDLARRDDYWGDYDSSLETVSIYTYGEAATMAMALEEGEIDLAILLLENDYERLAEEDGFAVDIIPTGDCRYLSMDFDDPYLSDENVRLAIAYGVNWAEVADAADGGISPQATSLVVSDSDFYVDVGAYEYDYDKAMEYLDASPFEPSDIHLSIVTTDVIDQINMAVVLQAYLADLGIDLSVESLEFSSSIVKWLNQECSLQWTDSSTGSLISDPYAIVKATSNVTGSIPGVVIRDDTYQDILAQATYTRDPEVRAEAFAELQQYVKDHALCMPVTELSEAIAWNTDVIESVNILNGMDFNLRYLDLK